MAEDTKTIVGEIHVMEGDIPSELLCPYGCDGGDVCVDSTTGICKFCKREFDIIPTVFTYTEPV